LIDDDIKTHKFVPGVGQYDVMKSVKIISKGKGGRGRF